MSPREILKPNKLQGQNIFELKPLFIISATSTAWLNLAGCAVDKATWYTPGAVFADRNAAVVPIAECGSRM